MVVPYEHAPALENVGVETLNEMMMLAREAEGHLRANYQPDGMNLGINIGKAAGRGCGRAYTHACPATLGCGRQFYDHRRRTARAAGGSRYNVRKAFFRMEEHGNGTLEANSKPCRHLTAA